MEWALADGAIVDARRLAKTFEQILRHIDRSDERLLEGYEASDVAFPAALAAMVEEFDSREYAAMSKAGARP
jgi:hypothetical protein